MNKSSSIKRVVFSGDGFRSASGDPDQLGNVTWLHNILGGLIEEITGLYSETRLPFLQGDTYCFISLQCDLAPSIENWAKLFFAEPTQRLVDTLYEEMSETLLVTIEMPPILERALDLAGIPWIDVSISPLRFLPDWALHVKASGHFDLMAAPHTLLTRKEIDAAVKHVSEWYGSADFPMNSQVFFAQTSQDRTLISDGRFVDIDKCVETFRNKSYGKPLFYKAHPWEFNNRIVSLLSNIGAEPVVVNTYSILSCPQASIVTISSSVGREARVFGRSTTILSPAVQDWAFAGVDVMRHATSPEFWVPLLASGGLTTAAADRLSTADTWRPNRLRETIPAQGLDFEVWR